MRYAEIIYFAKNDWEVFKFTNENQDKVPHYFGFLYTGEPLDFENYNEEPIIELAESVTYDVSRN